MLVRPNDAGLVTEGGGDEAGNLAKLPSCDRFGLSLAPRARPKPIDANVDALATVLLDSAAHNAFAEHVIDHRCACLELLPVGVHEQFSAVVHDEHRP